MMPEAVNVHTNTKKIQLAYVIYNTFYMSWFIFDTLSTRGEAGMMGGNGVAGTLLGFAGVLDPSIEE